MLTQLTIRNFAIIDQLSLEFGEGLTILTGETGAGKSILFDALGLTLGDRADLRFARDADKRCEVIAQFNADSPEAKNTVANWLEEQGIEQDDEGVLVRRTIEPGGRSRAFINDVPSTLQSLRALGSILVEVHGQHEHQRLTKDKYQERALDRFAQTEPLLGKAKSLFDQWRKVNASLSELRAQGVLSDAEKELLRYQLTELEQHAVSPEELERMHDSHAKSANREELLRSAGTSLELLDGETGASSAIANARDQLHRAASKDSALEEFAQLLDSALIQVEEASHGLQHYVDTDDDSLENPDELNRSLEAIHDLARKHRVEPEALETTRDQIALRLQNSEQANENESRLMEQKDALEAEDAAAAEKLHTQRQSAAKKLASTVTNTLAKLGMPKATFVIEVDQMEDLQPRANGSDQISFLFSANPGQSPAPIDKVASGGELSRLGLALRSALLNQTAVGCLLFDEVDAGIGGSTGEIVGSLLAGLASERQVMAITHLPQVAAFADHHFAIRKSQADDSTSTTVIPLDQSAREDELARMLSGVEVTEQSRANAQSLLNRAKAS